MLNTVCGLGHRFPVVESDRPTLQKIREWMSKREEKQGEEKLLLPKGALGRQGWMMRKRTKKGLCAGILLSGRSQVKDWPC